jgi:hypothetical protein
MFVGSCIFLANFPQLLSLRIEDEEEEEEEEER